MSRIASAISAATSVCARYRAYLRAKRHRPPSSQRALQIVLCPFRANCGHETDTILDRATPQRQTRAQLRRRAPLNRSLHTRRIAATKRTAQASPKYAKRDASDRPPGQSRAPMLSAVAAERMLKTTQRERRTDWQALLRDLSQRGEQHVREFLTRQSSITSATEHQILFHTPVPSDLSNIVLDQLDCRPSVRLSGSRLSAVPS